MAVIQVYAAYGAGPSFASVDSGPGNKVSFSKNDLYNDTSAPVTVPTTGRAFSFARFLCLYCVSGGGSSNLGHLRVAQLSQPTAGLELHVKADGSATHTYQSSVTAGPADDAVTSGAAPTGWIALKDFTNTVFYEYDTSTGLATPSGTPTGAAGKMGKYCVTVAAVLASYGGTGSSQTNLPAIRFMYDES